MLQFETLRRFRDLMVAIPVCLDPSLVRRQLLRLQEVLGNQATLYRQMEEELMRSSGVSLERSLAPFLNTADALFRTGRTVLPNIRVIVQGAMDLIGSPTGSTPAFSAYSCRNPGLIRGRLRSIDRSLASLMTVLVRSEAIYADDAARLRQIIAQPPPPAPATPPGTQVGPGLRATSLAERTALAAVRRARQEIALAMRFLLEALQEIVQNLVIRERPPIRVARLMM